MKILNIVLWVLLLTYTQAKEASWKKFTKELKSTYEAGDYNLQYGVRRLDIRSYDVDEKNRRRSPRYEDSIVWETESSYLLDEKTIKQFNYAKPNLSRKGNIGGRRAGSISNAFVIDYQDKIWQMNKVKDVISFMGEIDTPLEVQMVLWLHGKQKGNRYRKTSKGYEVIIEYTKSSDGCKGCKLSEMCIEDREIKEKAIISKKGEIILSQQVKSKVLNQVCIEKDR